MEYMRLTSAVEGAGEALESMFVRLYPKRERKKLVCDVHD